MRYLPVILILFIACTKKSPENKNIRTDFFISESDAFNKVQLALQQHNPKEQLVHIDNITYVDASQKTYAFVFYHSNMGNSNIVFQRNNHTTARADGGVTSIKCEGEDCDCKVKTVITREGDVNVDCSCKSCTMLINQSIL